MRKALPLFLLVILAFAGLGVYFARTTSKPSSAPVREEPGGAVRPQASGSESEIAVPVFEDNDYKLKRRKVKLSPGGDPVAKTLEALLKTSDDKNSDSAIPAGTELVSVKVKDGLATMELSDDFNMLNKKGDTTQSLAQQQLRAALAQFPDIRRMRVTVGGKTFEDGHSGPWENIPVRDDSASNATNTKVGGGE